MRELRDKIARPAATALVLALPALGLTACGGGGPHAVAAKTSTASISTTASQVPPRRVEATNHPIAKHKRYRAPARAKRPAHRQAALPARAYDVTATCAGAGAPHESGDEQDQRFVLQARGRCPPGSTAAGSRRVRVERGHARLDPRPEPRPDRQQELGLLSARARRQRTRARRNGRHRVPGDVESSLMPLDETISIMETMDTVLTQARQNA
jgi:hypothetical protein